MRRCVSSAEVRVFFFVVVNIWHGVEIWGGKNEKGKNGTSNERRA